MTYTVSRIRAVLAIAKPPVLPFLDVCLLFDRETPEAQFHNGDDGFSFGCTLSHVFIYMLRFTPRDGTGGSMFSFVDVFAGCGGLSLGLMQAGGTGLFAIEQNSSAFDTLSHNLLKGVDNPFSYQWPSWLPKCAHDIKQVLRVYERELVGLRGKVDVVVGGPPCQGFSTSGRRDVRDPRNLLFKQYLHLVRLVRPTMVLLENVRGIDIPFSETPRRGPNRHSRVTHFSDRIRKALESNGYLVFPTVLCAADFCVPQLRPRFFLVGVSAAACRKARYAPAPFAHLDSKRAKYLAAIGGTLGKQVSVREAISDLEHGGRELVESVDSPGFKQVRYRGPRTQYQMQMHGDLATYAPNSLRLANHRPETTKRFQEILDSCRRGVRLSNEDRKRFRLLKHRIYPLDSAKPAPTLTTLPDDVLHYSEPRILTVREYARLQSFPDWYDFKGPYTTGGHRRRTQCPRYTQVGNAVPVRLARFLGTILDEVVRHLPLTNRETDRGRRAA